jgi:YHS domain-containing protein
MKINKYIALALLGFLFTGVLQAQKTFSENGKAIRGYDPVAYHKENKAVAGADSLQFSWNNANWFFHSQENLQLFKADPGKYAPAYGGYCAYGVSENHLSPTDPEAFTIVNDTLYLNYNLKVRSLWQKDTKTRIQNANTYWPKLK